MGNPLYLILIAIFWLANTPAKQPMKHIFYLHGMIIEVQGINAVSPDFGPYEYTEIIEALEETGATVHHEVRTKETDFYEFGKKVSEEIDALIKAGVSPSDISVIGASKGGIMAMYISNINKSNINYVLLASNSDYTEKTFDWYLHGSILGIYEASDTVAGKDYKFWINRSKDAIRFEQLQIDTGLNHGFLYRPIDAWMGPAMKWINSSQ